jgi:hypothetical protein
VPFKALKLVRIIMKNNHEQIWVKVNAQVDKNIANIVTALNMVNGLLTLDSCEGDEDWAYVYFRYGDYKKICDFLFGNLFSNLTKKYGEDLILSVEVRNDLEPIGKISFRKELTNKLHEAIRTKVSAYRKLS